jgi:hypothetical protein
LLCCEHLTRPFFGQARAQLVSRPPAPLLGDSVGDELHMGTMAPFSHLYFDASHGCRRCSNRAGLRKRFPQKAPELVRRSKRAVTNVSPNFFPNSLAIRLRCERA